MNRSDDDMLNGSSSSLIDPYPINYYSKPAKDKKLIKVDKRLSSCVAEDQYRGGSTCSGVKSVLLHDEELPEDNNSYSKQFNLTISSSIVLSVIATDPDMTVGWVYSQFLRDLYEMEIETPRVLQGFKVDRFVCLQTLDGNHNLDYILSDPGKHLTLFPKLTELVPFLKEEIDNTSDLNISYFKLIKKLGDGGFSKVYLARRRDTGSMYAMKVVDKNVLLDYDKEEYLFNEKNIWCSINHPRICKLYYIFQTNNFVIFVMEYCPGGELFTHIRRNGVFSEKQTMFYFEQLVDALGYLHSKSIIYRDLKPENVMLDEDGNIKLVDFGLCKQLATKNDLTYSFCGSELYLSPEMILKTGHNYMLDIYTLGTLIFELLSGGCPIQFSPHRKEFISNILNQKIYFPASFSEEVKDLLSKMLQRNPEQRIGYNDDISVLLDHEWCKAVRSTYPIKNSKISPEYLPDIMCDNFQSAGQIHRTSIITISNDLLRDWQADIEPEKMLFGFSYDHNESSYQGKSVAIIKMNNIDDLDEGISFKKIFQIPKTMSTIKCKNEAGLQKQEQNKVTPEKGFFDFLF